MPMSNALEVRNLTASIGDLAILRGIDLDVPFGEVHAVMGPNGSGKSTLCHALMGKDEYTVAGSGKVDGVEIIGLPIHERSRAGLFEAFQYPTEVPGVTLDDLTTAMADSHPEDSAFDTRISAASDLLSMEAFRPRFVNVGLSGGEKKRSEMYLLGVARPKMAILDEIDSGLDIDAVREVAEMVETMRSDDMGILIITHYSRILRYMNVDKVHVMVRGKVVQTGGPEVADELEAGGYADLQAANA
jgi:Fe-S cluster assembly ATP-binding protein